MTPSAASGAKPENGGSTVRLREYIERILEERDRAQQATFRAAIREADANTRELERRLELLNELRAEVTRDRSKFLERKECDLKREPIDQRLAAIERWNAKVVGIGLVLIVVAGVLSSLVSIWVKG
jgi:hypothetical protein